MGCQTLHYGPDSVVHPLGALLSCLSLSLSKNNDGAVPSSPSTHLVPGKPPWKGLKQCSWLEEEIEKKAQDGKGAEGRDIRNLPLSRFYRAVSWGSGLCRGQPRAHGR